MKYTQLVLRLSVFMVFLVQSIAQANVVGVDTQNFNPTSNGIDFVTVESSETLQPGILNLGLFLNVAQNTLPRIYDSGTNKKKSFRDRLWSTDINVGLGVAENWDIGFNLPAVLSQEFKEDNSETHGAFTETGFNEFRLTTKYRFLGNEQGGVAASYTIGFNMIEDNPFVGKSSTPMSTIQLIADKTISDFSVGGNVGYRFRDSDGPVVTEPLVEPIEKQFIASLALSYLFEEIDTKLIGEIYTSFPAEDYEKTGDRDNSTSEFLIGMKHDLRTDLAVHFGAGAEIIHGTASPDWRLYTGLNWNFGPLWSEDKKDDDALSRLQQRRAERLAERKRLAERRRQAKDLEVEKYKPVGPPPVPSDFGMAFPSAGAGVYILRDINFGFNQDVPSAAAEEILNDLADYLLTRKDGFRSFVIEGHTDSIGKAAYNLDLSRRRAESIKSIIVRKYNLDANKIKAVGKGESSPIRSNSNYQGRAANRRVQVRID